jgi:hypothetical protein
MAPHFTKASVCKHREARGLKCRCISQQAVFVLITWCTITLIQGALHSHTQRVKAAYIHRTRYFSTKPSAVPTRNHHSTNKFSHKWFAIYQKRSSSFISLPNPSRPTSHCFVGPGPDCLAAEAADRTSARVGWTLRQSKLPSCSCHSLSI